MLTFLNHTLSERISGISIQADTHRSVANNTTVCVRPTSTRTWISTFLFHASKVGSTLAVTNTFRSTIRW